MMLNRKVLVLNQNYEPFAVCSAKRAIILLFLKKVQLVAREEVQVHSVSVTMPMPSIIRLNIYIHKPFRKVVLNRKNIHKRDNHTCQYCGRNNRPMTIDHVVPKSYGGEDSWENLVCACIKCNTKKGNRTPDESGMKLQRQPRKPSHIFFLQTVIGNPPQAWKPYLFIN